MYDNARSLGICFPNVNKVYMIKNNKIIYSMQTLNHNNFLNHAQYLNPFFVGLFEAKGGIYFHKVGVKSSRFFFIKLELRPENRIMLECINKHLELKASIFESKPTKKNVSKIIMHGSSKYTMDKLLSILEQFPPLDTKSALFKRLLEPAVFSRNKETHSKGKSKDQNFSLYRYRRLDQNPHYFKFWLSGFLEGRASFGIYSKNYCRIGISTRDYKLVNNIKRFFQSNNKIVTKTNADLTVLYQQVFTSTSIENVLIHLKDNPLLGYKRIVYDKFYSCFNKITKRDKALVPSLELGNYPMPFAPLDYIEPFFVGLFEGDGSIYLGRTKGRNKSYGRFQIKLKYNPENHHMLELVRKGIGGTIHYENNKKGNDQIVWAAISQKDVKNILAIFEKSPLLTSRKICQLEYLKQCMANRSWDFHLKTRDSKYDGQQGLIKNYNQRFEIPDYFAPWLSGFVEAEGSFRSTHALISFYICQNDDRYILDAIKIYFDSHNKLSLHKDLRKNAYQYHYRVSMSGKPVLERIIKHFEVYPLLGYKKVSYDLFCSKFYKNK